MPIINVEGVGRIEFPESMTGEQIDAAIKNEILPVFRQRAPDAAAAADPAASVPDASLGANPYSKGTAQADAEYRIGDRYEYRALDLVTNLESRQFNRTVTAITDTEVIFNNGNLITDLLGNIHKNRRGQTFTGNQIFVAEYRLGRKWNTTYRGTRRNLEPDVWNLDFKVVAREAVTTPAGTFDAFKVAGQGYITDRTRRFQITYWVAPDKVRSFIAFEETKYNRKGQPIQMDRAELVSFGQRGRRRAAQPA